MRAHRPPSPLSPTDWQYALVRGMDRLGLQAPEVINAAEAYRELVQATWVQGGWIALPRLAQTLPSSLGLKPGLVTAASQMRACQPGRAMHWQAVSPSHALWQRRADASEPLVAAQDDFMALGFAAACLERAGLSEVQVWVAGMPVYPWADEPVLARLAAQGATHRARFSWAEGMPLLPSEDTPHAVVARRKGSVGSV